MIKRVKTAAAVTTLAAVLSLGLAPVFASVAEAKMPATSGSSIEQVQSSTGSSQKKKKPAKKSSSKKSTKKTAPKKTS